jgi:hypothetical protein
MVLACHCVVVNKTLNIGYFSSNRNGFDAIYSATPIRKAEAIVLVTNSKTKVGVIGNGENLNSYPRTATNSAKVTTDIVLEACCIRWWKVDGIGVLIRIDKSIDCAM